MSIPNYQALAASNGSGEPVRAIVQANRSIGSGILTVNATTNWPTGTFIATTGTLQSNGTLNPATVQVFYGTASGTTITITSYASGYSDLGSSIADVVVVKPSTEWANIVSNSMGYVVGLATQAANGWQSLGATPTYSSNSGNKEFVLATSTDLTGTLSPGMKLQYQPTSQTATQSALFASASSQYATKSSPTGITFTTAFTVIGWVFPLSYTTGSAIISRADGTNGWGVQIDSAGQVQLFITNFGTYQTSYQSLPLNQWTHVAATFSAGTMIIYINGTLVSSTKTGSGTSLTQAGALQIGAQNSNNFFNGYISQVALYSAALTQATIQSYMTKTLTGSESTCVGFWSLNGGWSDISANANTLTPTNAPIATSTVCPFNATEYAVINTITSSTITVDCGTMCTVPNQTLQNFYYSTAEDPYGLSSGLSKNRTLAHVFQMANYATTSSTSSTAGGMTATITVPLNKKIRITAICKANNGSAGVNVGWYINDGAIGGGTILQDYSWVQTVAGYTEVGVGIWDGILTAGSHTIAVGTSSSDNSHTTTIIGAVTNPFFLRIETID